MEESAIQLYQQLNIQDKRNEFSDLLEKKDLQAPVTVKNYNKNEHSSLKEDEILTFFYEDVTNIKNKIMALAVLIDK